MENTEKKQILEKLRDLKFQLDLLILKERKENSAIIRRAFFELQNGIGHFVSGDYYAPDRVYIEERGIKNIRMSQDREYLLVKITQQVELPIEIDGLKIEVIQSKKYNHKL